VRARCIEALIALRIGIVQGVVPRDQLLPHVRTLASEIAENAPLAAQTIKRAINNWAERGMTEALKFEAATASVNFVSDDMQLGYNAAGKEKAKFEGK
jgi:enoyl-CoA hydratase